jgi:hypothetical protein
MSINLHPFSALAPKTKVVLNKNFYNFVSSWNSKFQIEFEIPLKTSSRFWINSFWGLLYKIHFSTSIAPKISQRLFLILLKHISIYFGNSKNFGSRHTIFIIFKSCKSSTWNHTWITTMLMWCYAYAMLDENAYERVYGTKCMLNTLGVTL